MAAVNAVALAPSRATGRRAALRSPSLALFLALFTSQAGVLVVTPILVDMARDFGVSTALAGQLRLVAAPLAAVAAVCVARSGGRVAFRTLLLAGAALVAAGSLASAAAPTFELLALAQVPTWIGTAVLVAAGVGAAGSWAPPEDRARVVSRALAGAPAAWIVGMPLVGLAAHAHWRLAFVVLPLPAAAVALAAIAAQPRDAIERRSASLSGLLRAPQAAAWATGELLANAAWAGTLVFSGALFVEVHGVSPRVAGVLLAVAAVAFLAGNQIANRVAPRCTRRALVRADLAAAAAVAALWAVTPNAATTLAAFAAAAYAAGARTLWGTAYGFAVAGERKLEVGAMRAVTTQLGYLIGSLVGGVALAIGGYALMGAVFASLFAAAAVAHVCVRGVGCAARVRVALAG